MLHLTITTTLAPGVFMITDQFGDTEVECINKHIDAFVKFHPELTFGTFETTWVVRPPKADDPMAVGGRPA